MDTQIIELPSPESNSLIDLLSEQLQVHEPKEIAIIKERVLRCFQAMKDQQTLTFLVAINSHTIVGYILIQWLRELWTDFPEAFISNFYVSLSYRKKGIGSLLLEKAIQEAKKRNAARLFLENSKNNSIYQNQFYLKKGWHERSDIAIFEFPLREKD